MAEWVRPRAPRWTVGIAVAALCFGATAVLAADAPAPAAIDGCYAKRDGSLRVLTSGTCNAKSETPLSWSAQGPAGPAGPAGPVGPAGPAGPAGDAVITGLQCPDQHVVAGFDQYGRMICRELLDGSLGTSILVGEPVGALDTDGDGVIDDEDSCPTSPGPWCPTTVYDIRNGLVSPGSAVTFEVVITSDTMFMEGGSGVLQYINSTGQVVPGMPGYDGQANSSIGILNNVGATVGDRVRIVGIVVSDTLVDGGAADILEHGVAVAPVPVDPGELTSSDFIYGLVSVADVTVTNGSDGRWSVGGVLEVVGFPQTGTHLPEVPDGTVVSSIVGILSWGPDLYPRTVDDISVG